MLGNITRLVGVATVVGAFMLRTAALAETLTGSSGFVNATATDADGDGVPDASEPCICLGTPAGDAVTTLGCAADQLCPCTAPIGFAAWANHGKYVRCIKETTLAMQNAGALTATQRVALVRAAAQANCGPR